MKTKAEMDFETKLLTAIDGNGEVIKFTSTQRKSNEEYYSKAFEEIQMKTTASQANSRKQAAGIYITF